VNVATPVVLVVVAPEIVEATPEVWLRTTDAPEIAVPSESLTVTVTVEVVVPSAVMLVGFAEIVDEAALGSVAATQASMSAPRVPLFPA